MNAEKIMYDSLYCDKNRTISYIDDWELVQRCQEIREPFFSELIKRHYTLVINICFRFFLDKQLAEDTAQEVFLKVYEQIEDVHPGKQPFVHWLCRITTNSCKSLYRKRTCEKNNVNDGKVDFWYNENLTEIKSQIDSETNTAVKYVNDALKQLKPDERIVLILAHIAELKTREIASVIKVPEYSVRRSIRRAEEKLRKLVTQRTLEEYARQ